MSEPLQKNNALKSPYHGNLRTQNLRGSTLIAIKIAALSLYQIDNRKWFHSSPKNTYLSATDKLSVISKCDATCLTIIIVIFSKPFVNLFMPKF